MNNPAFFPAYSQETTLKEFVLQRRRWLNGTTAGYVWLLQNEHLWEALSRRRVLAVLVLLMSILQLVVFGIVFCLPGIMVITGFLAIDGLFVVLELARFEVPYAYEVKYYNNRPSSVHFAVKEAGTPS